MLSRSIIILLVSLLCQNSIDAQEMNNQSLRKIIKSNADSLSGDLGNWQFVFESLPMLCLTDEVHNRMRILTPVADADDLHSNEVKRCLEANFHTALDVKYAISDNVLWVVFIHPLKELSKDQVIDAIYQVYNAAATFGTSYSSTYLAFPERGRQINKKPKKILDKS